MKKKQLIGLTLFLLSIMPKVNALICPNKDEAPLCPLNGITLLDETYPTQSFVISNAPQINSKESLGMAQQFINKIIKSYDYENVPQIILAIDMSDEFSDFKNETKQELINNKISKDKIEKILNQMTFAPIYNFPWQQDWFEAFVDLKTGTPLIKQMHSYGAIQEDAGEQLTKVGGQCSIQIGKQLKEDPNFYTGPHVKANKSIPGGEMGGNIEGAPGGFCLIGNNLGKSVALQVCNEESNIIQLKTSWLLVGHVDEIFKIIPTQFNDGRPLECEFSLMSASPKKALELMKDPKLGQLLFTEFNDPNSDPDEMKYSRTDIKEAGNFFLCQYIEEAIRNRPPTQKVTTTLKNLMTNSFLPNEARADEASMQEFLKSITGDNKKMSAFTASCARNFDKVTNFELQAVMLTDSKFTKLNSAIDESIQKDRELIKDKILSRLPQCIKWYNEIEVPNLFYGDSPIETADKKLELSHPGTAGSFLPNPTNSVLVNKTVIFSNTGNKLFNNYLSEEMTKKKMKSDFISTWDYGHIENGNIHCVSHSIPHCRPRIQKK